MASQLGLSIETLLAADSEMSHEYPSTPTDASPAAIVASLSDTFLASELYDLAGSGDVIGRSEVVMQGGIRRLRMKESDRTALLADVMAADDRSIFLEQTRSADVSRVNEGGDDPQTRSAFLRRFVSGAVHDLQARSPATLRAACAALTQLRGVILGSQVPTRAEVQRLLERAELLEPLRMCVGAEGAWDIPPSSDRFVGRDAELRHLRAFVNEIDSLSVGEGISRKAAQYLRSIAHTFGQTNPPGVRLIVARGGLGKSALVGKFVLDHALVEESRFPFAYIDFDRATIRTRDPRHLLLEVMRQVGLQFPKASAHITDLRQQLQHSIQGTGSSPSGSDPFDDFKHAVRNEITHGSRAFLIVLDTLEIPQADPESLKGLLLFVERMSRGGFSELRVVAAGRAEVQELVEAGESYGEGTVIRLDPLSPEDARTMVGRLGTSVLGAAWKNAWTPRLAGKDSDSPTRREPLSLRVAVEIIRDEDPENRDAKSRTIEALGDDNDDFVGKLYVNRVVGHVAGGPDVQKVAWPGLVLRRVSVEIIHDLLCPVFGIEPSRAQDIYAALKHQVWIVVQESGDVLRHQPELRARTLPFMRKQPDFTAINAKAIEYFSSRRSLSFALEAEWIYHRLLGGESYRSVDGDWNDRLVPYLQNAHEDFPSHSETANYLAARTASWPLSDATILSLDPRLALIHLSRTSAVRGAFADTSIDPVLSREDWTSTPALAGEQEAETVRQCILIKTGRWSALPDSPVVPTGLWTNVAVSARGLLSARSRHPTYGVPNSIGTLAGVIQWLPTARLRGDDVFDSLDARLADELRAGVGLSDSEISAPVLRIAMLFGERSQSSAARLWIEHMIERNRASEKVSFSGRELIALSRQVPSLAKYVSNAFAYPMHPPDTSTRREHSNEFAPSSLDSKAARSDYVRFEDEQLAYQVYEAVSQLAESNSAANAFALRQFAFSRDEDWLIPLAYAAHGATNGVVPKTLAGIYETHLLSERNVLVRNVFRVEVPTDMLAALRQADEAGDVVAACRLCLEAADRERAHELRALLRKHSHWRANVGAFLEHLIRMT